MKTNWEGIGRAELQYDSGIVLINLSSRKISSSAVVL